MSLYYDAATFISNPIEQTSSLKSRVYGANGLKSTPAQLFALVTEASKWSSVLTEVIERSQLLVHEKKISPPLGLLLVHDLLLAQKGIAAPALHPLRLAVERHKARLRAEFTKARVQRGFSSVEALKANLDSDSWIAAGITSNGSDSNGTERWPHPRWVRINTLKTSLEEQLATTFATYKPVSTLTEVLKSTISSDAVKPLHVDIYIPDLIALPPATDLSTLPAYKYGLLILQDKASCFPAYLLSPRPLDGDIIDACAAPGNKTTHLAALLASTDPNPSSTHPTIWACERDKTRALTLQKMISTVGATDLVKVKAGQDFLQLDPNAEPWRNVGALLLDPSCSGSGIIGRDEARTVVLPSIQSSTLNSRASKKRKRKPQPPPPAPHSEPPEEPPSPNPENQETLRARLLSLSTFQTRLLRHAFSFPRATKITYSTCSLHAEENEAVILAALASPIARERGWAILPRESQVSGMRDWAIRGNIKACGGDGAVADACIRCPKSTREGTQGFFVVGFVRRGGAGVGFEGEEGEEGDKEGEEWSGFADSDG